MGIAKSVAACHPCIRLALTDFPSDSSRSLRFSAVSGWNRVERAAADMNISAETLRRFQILNHEQVERLDTVLHDVVHIHGRGNFPTLEVNLKHLVEVVRDKLAAEGVPVRDVRLNGSAASYVLGTENQLTFNDLDLIFGVDLSNLNTVHTIKRAVLDSLLEFLPAGVSRQRMGPMALKEAYVQKMVKICHEGDRWSLISLTNNRGKHVELKFMDAMRRQFEFSVDSFQIILDSLLDFHRHSRVTMTPRFYPSVLGESVYGDFEESLRHLNGKLIATRNPEEIRGGGLLKYCNLLVRDYAPAAPHHIKTLERYMCSRFFIDFSDLGTQRSKLESYLANHFAGDERRQYAYLMTLRRVVEESTVCLMGHERRQTLELISQLAGQVQFAQLQTHNAQNNNGGGTVYCLTTPYFNVDPYNNSPPSWMICA